MFLIEYDKGLFIDGKKVNWLKIDVGDIKCSLDGDTDTIVIVEKSHQPSFINNLQALNSSFSVESFYHEVNNAT